MIDFLLAELASLYQWPKHAIEGSSDIFFDVDLSDHDIEKTNEKDDAEGQKGTGGIVFQPVLREEDGWYQKQGDEDEKQQGKAHAQWILAMEERIFCSFSGSGEVNSFPER